MLHNEARKLLVEAFDKTHNAKETAEYFSVDRSTVYRILERRRKTGDITTRTYLRGRKRALSKEDIDNIEKLVAKTPDITMKEIVQTLNLKVCPDTVRKTLIRLGYTRKKKSIHATEQERPRRSGEKKELERHYIWHKR